MDAPVFRVKEEDEEGLRGVIEEQIDNPTVELIKGIPTKRSSKRIEEQSVDVPVPRVVPQDATKILEVMKDRDTCQERTSERFHKKIVENMRTSTGTNDQNLSSKLGFYRTYRSHEWRSQVVDGPMPRIVEEITVPVLKFRRELLR